MRLISGSLMTLALMLVSLGLGGCGGRPVTAEWFKHADSYDIKGQDVQINMLTYEDMKNYASTRYPGVQNLSDEWDTQLERDFPWLFGEEALPVIGFAVVAGYALDAVKAQLEAEAKLYEAQYGDKIHETGFWEYFTPIHNLNKDNSKNGDPVGYRGTPRWYGFEIVRTTATDRLHNKRLSEARKPFEEKEKRLAEAEQLAEANQELTEEQKEMLAQAEQLAEAKKLSNEKQALTVEQKRMLAEDEFARKQLQAPLSAASRIVFAMIPATEYDHHHVIAAYQAEVEAAEREHREPKHDYSATKPQVDPRGRTTQAPFFRPNVDDRTTWYFGPLPSEPDPAYPRADERLFVIKPMWLEVNRSRAKVSQFGPGMLDLTVNIKLDAIWIDGNQGVHNDTVATTDFDMSDISLDAEPPSAANATAPRNVIIDDLESTVAGWFAGVPVSFDAATKKPKGNGTFTLAIAVTEKDQSQAKEMIERAAKYIGDNKDTIIERVGGGGGAQ